MRIRDRLSYANVTATLALVVAMATGGAYAQSQIGTNEIQDRAVTSKKIKKGAVRNANVRGNALTGAKIREGTLNAFQFSAMNGAQDGLCNPDDVTFLTCVATTVQLPSPGRILVVATGGAYSATSEPAKGNCQVRLNNQPQPLGEMPGEEGDSTTDASATNGFARTLVTPVVPPGNATLSLACNQAGTPDFGVRNPTIAAIALTNGR